MITKKVLKMVHMPNMPMYSTEMFQVITENLPSLSAYRLVARGSDQQVRVGRKLADRLMRIFGGHWVWTDNLIITDIPKTDDSLEQAIRGIRSKEKDVFKDLSALVSVDHWQPSAKAQADFVAQGLFADLGNQIQAALLPVVNLDGKATVEREFEIRGWVVKGQPAVSISIESRVIFKDDLKTYFSKLASPDDLVGMFVSDKVRFDNGTVMKGEIISIAGQLDIDVPRQDLLDIAQREGSKQLIQKAEKGEYVVRVGYNEYEYVLSALRIVVFTKHYRRYGIDTKKAQNATWIAPSERAALVKKVSDIARVSGLIGTTFTSQHNGYFFPASKFQYDPSILLGANKGSRGKIEYRGGNSLINAISQHGLYNRVSTNGSLETPLRIGIINTSHQSLDQMQAALIEQLKLLGFLRTETLVTKTAGVSRIDFERAINHLSSFEPHIILAIIPDSDSLDEDDWSPYYDFKSLMMDLQMPSQVIDQNTLKNTKGLPYVMQNVAFGMSAKMGNTPYILANPLDYADMAVGIDIARKRNKKGTGTQNAAAIAQVFHQGGQFVRCSVVETPLEGETVPANVLRSLFPLNEFQNKNILIHRDGLFRGNEVEVIKTHLSQMGSQPYFIEVIKSGAPRIYASKRGKIDAPEIGTAFILSDTEGFIVASESSVATPQPLQVRTQSPFTIGKALHSTLMLTLMHYGSLKRPKLPITIHYSDKIGYLALRGVKPAGGLSTDMYWL
jgi:hypothetical protein